MRALFGIFFFVIVAATPSVAQSIHQAKYSLQTKPLFCYDVLEIDSVNKKAYYMSICGCILGEQIMMVGVSKFTRQGNLWTFTPIAPAQFVSVGVRDYTRNEARTVPSIVFIDVNGDTAQIDSILTFVPRKLDKPRRRKGIGLDHYTINPKKIHGRTHFTLPYISRFFYHDMIIKIPDEYYNQLLLHLKFPGYFVPGYPVGNYLYAGIGGKFTQVNDTTLVENRRRRREKDKIVFVRQQEQKQ